MQKIMKFALAGAALMATATLYAQETAEQLSVTTTPLKDNLYLLKGRGGNVVASVGEDGVMIVDDDYPQYAPAYNDAINALTGDESTARFVINTHWHGDHTGGNEYWGDRGAVIVAHINVRERMSTRQEMKAMDRVVEPSPRSALPVVTFGDSLALHFNNEDIEVQHLPAGHTDGDSVVFFTAQNLVHMGDHFFKDAFPFVDIGSGGNVLSFTRNIETMLARVDDQTVIVPGHGTVANKADLQRYLDMLHTTTALVQGKLEQGMSVEAITEEGLGEEWASWGQGFIKEAYWIGFIAGSL
jgi:glyoxylase-like metal-dependent hydrolase (beta-lactamase superfamily II)